MPDESCLVVDSGLHQMLARRHFRVRFPRSFILPTDLQSMGFALPAAIGARIARPDRPVVALLGDGGFSISGLELLTAVRERVRLTVVVFNDGHYGLIRKQQLMATRHAFGTELHNPNFREIAQAAGARYERPGDDAEESLHRAVASHGVTLVEVALRDPGGSGRGCSVWATRSPAGCGRYSRETDSPGDGLPFSLYPVRTLLVTHSNQLTAGNPLEGPFLRGLQLFHLPTG